MIPIYLQQAVATPTLSLNLLAVSGPTGLSVLQTAQTVNSRALVLPDAQALVAYQPSSRSHRAALEDSTPTSYPAVVGPAPRGAPRWQSSKFHTSYI